MIIQKKSSSLTPITLGVIPCFACKICAKNLLLRCRFMKLGAFRVLKIACALLLAVFAAVAALVALTYVYFEAIPVSRKIGDIRPAEYGLVLGTSKFFSKNVPNLYYQGRIAAAAELYKAGKIRKIIASGDYSTRYYNEPKNMRDDLVKSGVNASDIILDNAGLRTYDSIRRCRDIFGAESPVVVSQAFHCRRALFLARNLGMKDVQAFAAKDSANLPTRMRNLGRESLARVKAVLDILQTD